MNKIIVIPVYKQEPTADEQLSLRQCLKILSAHPICLVCPKSLNIQAYCEAAQRDIPCERFDDSFFKGIEGYNRLMQSRDFYKRFAAFEYMLIYQLDAWVFRDELEAWCQKGYDYIGAPWFEKHFSHEEGYKLWCAGNGGFSLRRIPTFIRVLKPRQRMKTIHEIFRNDYHSISDLGHCLMLCMGPLFGSNSMHHYMKSGDMQQMWEDEFFCIGLSSTHYRLRIPSPEEAAHFSFEISPQYLFDEITQGKLPFGCHAWRKYQYEDFWKHYINFPEKYLQNAKKKSIFAPNDK